MNFREYINAVVEDVKDSIECGDYDGYTDASEVYEEMFTDDAITGNGSGSYTFNAALAEEYASGVLFDPEFLSELEAYGYTLESLAGMLSDGAETVDVIARCIALPYAFAEIDVDEMLERRAS